MKRGQVNKERHRLQLGDCAQVEMKHIEADIRADLIVGGGEEWTEEKRGRRKVKSSTDESRASP